MKLIRVANPGVNEEEENRDSRDFSVSRVDSPRGLSSGDIFENEEVREKKNYCGEFPPRASYIKNASFHSRDAFQPLSTRKSSCRETLREPRERATFTGGIIKRQFFYRRELEGAI